MEPVTHILTGAVLARTGFNRRAAYATLGMAIAAEFPDIDTLWSLGGPIPGLLHHRGITHTFVGIPFEAALLTGAIYLFHRVRKRETKAPVNWLFLYGAILVALLSHLFLDWTNNYGLRPFFPFDPHWYAGSFVFIFEPILFVLLLIGLIAPALFGLINSEIGAPKERFRGQGWAIAALVGIGVLWSVRFLEHDRALQIASTTDAAPQATRFSASPYPINPFKWHVVADTPAFDQLYTIDTHAQTATTEPEDTLYKSAPTLATLEAKRSSLGEAYLDWSQYPLVEQTPDTPDGLTPVVFRDARFLYNTFLMDGRRKTPLSGTVFVNINADREHRVDHMELDGRKQH
jgi:inner membrane protein